MARTLAARPAAVDAVDSEVEKRVAAATDASLISDAAYEEVESSARLITPPEPVPPKLPFRGPAELVTMPGPSQALPLPDEPPRFASHNWRAEAWERERDRELHTGERRTDAPVRRRSKA